MTFALKKKRACRGLQLHQLSQTHPSATPNQLCSLQVGEKKPRGSSVCGLVPKPRAEELECHGEGSLSNAVQTATIVFVLSAPGCVLDFRFAPVFSGNISLHLFVSSYSFSLFASFPVAFVLIL